MTPKLMLESAALTRETSDFGGILSYGGSSYLCSIGPMTSESRLTAGGFALSKDVQVVVRKSACDAAFRPGQTVTVTDKHGTTRTLKIASDGVNDLIYLWQLTLSDPAQ